MCIRDRSHSYPSHAKKIQMQDQLEAGSIECWVSKTMRIGFVDSGSDATIMRLKVAQDLGLTLETQPKTILAYGKILVGATLGKATVQIQLGSYEIQLQVQVVSDDRQEEDVLIGRDILYRAELSHMVKPRKWYFFKIPTEAREPESISQLLFCTFEALSIPARTLQFCEMKEEETEGTMVYVDFMGKSYICLTA